MSTGFSTAHRGARSGSRRWVLIELACSNPPTPRRVVASLQAVLSRIEDMSHVLAWTSSTSRIAAGGLYTISMIELPRLKLRLQPRLSPTGAVRLTLVDNAGWFVSDSHFGAADGAEDGGAVAISPRVKLLGELLEGIPHCLILENDGQQLQVLVANHPMRRPKVMGRPFSTDLVFLRSDEGWSAQMHDTPFFLYPVHTSRTFLLNKTLDAALYLILLRFMARDYSGAFRMTEACTVDVDFTESEKWVFNQLRHVKDKHPDAHALRLQLSLALQYSNNKNTCWDLNEEIDGYLMKSSHVSADCRHSLENEKAALRMCKTETAVVKARKK